VAGSLKLLGQRIQSLRKARGWSQERFADICGVHRTYMGHLERGEKNLSFNTLVRLSDALGITLSELLAEEAGQSSRKRAARDKSPLKGSLQPDDLDSIIRELNQRRMALEEAAGALKDVAEALRTREKGSKH
jgi:transcriptional regulator with XRE-family HTH domain